MRDDVPAWSELVGREAAEPVAYPYFETRDVGAVRRPSRQWLRNAVAGRRVLTLARGKHLALPRYAAPEWRADPIEVAWMMAAARFGRQAPYVSALSAAFVHGAAPRVHGEVHVTVPRWTRSVALPGLDTTVTFHERDPEEWLKHIAWRFLLARRGEEVVIGEAGDIDGAVDMVQPVGVDVETVVGELCNPRVSSPAQTLLDLAHSPMRAGEPAVATDAAAALLRLVDFRELRNLASRQRRHDAVERVGGFREPRRRP
ncbi:hypothetical protein [Demequina subtropica]|uniref:hypothetical protein n=1 Tax=Demequina subtropica TaxID=1638989 RepID=UPI00078092DC|nr:hypothetical protein [Demequina subtropica]